MHTRYIYVIRNLVNSKIYVGQTKNLTQRRNGHWFAARQGYRNHLYDAMRKHGVDNFVFELVETCTSEIIDDRERYWITFLGSMDPTRGYNKESGGHAQKTLSEETKRKISIANKGKSRTAEQIEKTASKLRGRPNLKSRKEFNPEKGRKISETLTGRRLSLEHRNSTSKSLRRYMAQRGEWHPSDAAKVNMSIAQKIVGARRTKMVSVDPSHPDAQPKLCPECGHLYPPKKLTCSQIKRHLQKRWCSRKCGRIAQNKKT